MEGTVREQRLEHGIDAADGVEILRQKPPAGLQVGEERRALGDACEIVEREADARLVRDGGNMQGGIGGAAGGRDSGAGVLEAFFRYELTRRWSRVREQLHHRRTGLACEARSIG